MLEIKTNSIAEHMSKKGVSRRQFLQFCGLMAAALALPATASDVLAAALATSPRVPVIWLELGDCTGDSEAFIRAGAQPDPLNGGSEPVLTDLLLDVISIEYHDLLMVNAGQAAEAQRQAAMSKYAGQYVLVVEGSIPAGATASYCMIGGRTAASILSECAANAAAIFALGACAVDGGLSAARPYPIGATGVATILSNPANLVNFPGCPANPVNVVAVVAYMLANGGALPPRDTLRRPSFAYGSTQRIHSHCIRHDNGVDEVSAWDDAAHHKGGCLRDLGCRGPVTYSNCWSVGWNGNSCWPILAGHGCIGCATANFWDTMSPFYVGR